MVNTDSLSRALSLRVCACVCVCSICLQELVDQTGYQATVQTETQCELFWGKRALLEDILESSDLVASINHHHALFTEASELRS